MALTQRHYDDDIWKPLHDEMLQWVDHNIHKAFRTVFPEYNLQGKKIFRSWQEILRQDYERGPIIGVVDLFASVVDDIPTVDDVQQRPHFRNCFAFLIKTEIPSLSALVREIKLCKSGHIKKICSGDHSSVVERTPFTVVCPSDTHELELNEQGFHFFKYNRAPKP